MPLSRLPSAAQSDETECSGCRKIL